MADFVWTDRNRDVYRAHLTMRIRAGEEILERIERVAAGQALPADAARQCDDLRKVIAGYQKRRADTDSLTADHFDRIFATRIAELLKP